MLFYAEVYLLHLRHAPGYFMENVLMGLLEGDKQLVFHLFSFIWGQQKGTPVKGLMCDIQTNIEFQY